MTRQPYQKLTKVSDVRLIIICFKNDGFSSQEISNIMFQYFQVRIPPKTIQSIKEIKRKSKYREYRSITKSQGYLQFTQNYNHLLDSSVKKMKQKVSELVKNEFPQPFSHFSSRTHQNCLSGILKKIKKSKKNQSLQLSQSLQNFQDDYQDYFNLSETPMQSAQSQQSLILFPFYENNIQN